jgi:hypothetical protein
MTTSKLAQTMRRSKDRTFTFVQDERLGPQYRTVYMDGNLLGYISGRPNSWRPVLIGLDWRELIAHKSMVSAARAMRWFFTEMPQVAKQVGRFAA